MPLGQLHAGQLRFHVRRVSLLVRILILAEDSVDPVVSLVTGDICLILHRYVGHDRNMLDCSLHSTCSAANHSLEKFTSQEDVFQQLRRTSTGEHGVITFIWVDYRGQSIATKLCFNSSKDVSIFD